MNKQHILRRIKCVLKYGNKHDFENEHVLFVNPKAPPTHITWRSICKICGAYQIRGPLSMIGFRKYIKINIGPEGRMLEYWKVHDN